MPQGEMNTVCKEITFSSDEFVLKGTLHLPQGFPRPPVVIGSHGLLGNRNSPKQVALAEACNTHGIAYFRFDHRGCGESEGVFREVTSLEARCRDLISAVTVIREREDTGTWTALFGSSLGGTTCLTVARQLGVRAIVTFAASLRSAPIIKAIEEADDEESKAMKAAVDVNRLQFDIFREVAGIGHILIFHGDSDKVISPSEAHRIYQQAEMPKRLIMQKNGDHRMSLRENQDKFIREAVAWYKTTLREHPPDLPQFKA